MKVVDYYMHPQSPWTYLGHARFGELARRHGARVNVKPVDYLGVVFPSTGGLPVGKRAPQRQAYRLTELRRWRDYLGMSLVLQPRHFPIQGNAAAELICAAPEEKRMALAGELLAALWRDDRNTGDARVLAEIGERHGVREADNAAFRRHTEEALAAGVFGAPSYVLEGEIFWGQDRLDLLERALSRPISS
jgi:2-hydroxychromene-2-carboxylate isomerase